MKRCSKCGEWKNEDEFYTTGKHGNSWCKVCHRAWGRNYNKEYRKRHKDDRVKYITNYYKQNPQAKTACNTRCYYKHPEYAARGYFKRTNITPTQELLDLKAKQIALVRAIRKQKEAKA